MVHHRDQMDLYVLHSILDHILSDLAQITTNAHIQQYGCGALMNKAVNPDYMDRIVGRGGIVHIIISAIEAQEPNGMAQQDCCVFLEWLLATPKEVSFMLLLSSFLLMNVPSVQSTLSKIFGAAFPGYSCVSHFYKPAAFFPCYLHM